jgi:type IV pilus assembly protein PilN
MNDFNFFSTFEKQKLAQKKKIRRSYGAILGVILVVVLFYGIMGARMLYCSYAINKGEAFLNAPENKAKLTDIQAKKAATENLITYTAQVNQAKQKITLATKVSSEFLNTIQKTIPAAVSLKSLEIKDYQVILQGTVPASATVAELAHNLEATELFSRVQVQFIQSGTETAAYEFSVLCELKEVAE